MQVLKFCTLVTFSVGLHQHQGMAQPAVAQALSANEGIIKLLVGTYTGDGSDGIYSLDFDPANGTMSNAQLLVETTNPSYLAVSKNGEYVYCVNETRDGRLSSFKWDDAQNRLIFVSEQESAGDHPCYIELNRAENLVAVANYSSGNVSVYPINSRGVIESRIMTFKHEGIGPVKPNQDGARAHCVKFDHNQKFLYAVDLGMDQIVTYPVLDTVVQRSQLNLKLDPGDGPRHLIFHPTKDLAFVMNELSSTVVSLKVDHNLGSFQRIDKISTLPQGFEGKNYCADIHISRDGQFLYASNRGDHSIAIFAVSADGHLTSLGREPVRGEWPRNFTLSPDEKFLLVANQHSNNITVFEIDPNSGLLTFTGIDFPLSKPVALKF